MRRVLIPFLSAIAFLAAAAQAQTNGDPKRGADRKAHV